MVLRNNNVEQRRRNRGVTTRKAQRVRSFIHDWSLTHKPPAGRNRSGGVGKTPTERIDGLSSRMLLLIFRAVAQLIFELLLRPMVVEHMVHPASTGGVGIAAEDILIRGSHDRLRLLPRHLSTGRI